MDLVFSASPISLNRHNTWSANLIGVFHSSLSFGDIDNDGDYDMVSMGCTAGGVVSCTTADKIRIYINNETTFNENLIWEANTTNLGYGSLALGDIDNDGDLDLIVLGDKGGGTGDVQIYTNNGTTFNESLTWEQNLSNVDAYAGSLSFGDIDNDGDLDLALVGTYPSSDNGIYINNDTSFIKDSTWLANLPYVGHGLGMGALALGDIDNDGDLDLIFAGSYGTNFYSGVYINNGTSLVENSSWKGDFTATFGWPSLILGDYDNDGDLDLSVIGTRAGDHLEFYNNTGTSFSLHLENGPSNSLAGFFDGSITFGDIENDGDLDLAAMGKESGRNFIYTNNNSVFERDIFEQQDMRDDNMQQGSLAFWDIDNDNNIDLAINGKQGDSSTYLFKIYISNASLTKNNTQPLSPNSSFSANYVNNVLTLSWGNGSDAETNTSGLYYNLRVGNTTNNNSIVSGVYGGSSNPTAGYFGNMMQRKSISLNVQLEANKTYYWYVQTIDTGLAKSNWSSLQTFNTSLDVTKPNVTIQHPSPNASLHTTNPYFIFNVTVTDANLTNVTLNANWSGSWHINQSNSSGINGTYTFSANLTNNNDGHYAWYIGANDSSNNSETSGIRDFFLDRAYPLVYLVSPANGASWTSSSTITFSYNVSDVDIANCSLIIDNSIDQTDTIISVNINQTFTKTLANGNYNWNVNCTDYVGYTNSSAIRSLTVNYVAPSSSGGGGGGGGGTSITTNTYTATNEQLIQGYTQQLANNDKIKFSINNINHSLTVNNISSDNVNLTLNSIAINFVIYVNETRKFELTNDSYYDLLVKLNSIESNKANLTIKSTYEEISKEKIGKEAKAEEAEKEEIKKKKLLFWVILVVIAVILIVLIKFLRSYIKYKKWRKYSFVG